MMDHVSIRNFRSLRNVSVDLKPLTVLVGPNDSGKSTFLGALERLSSGTLSLPDDCWRENTEETIAIRGRTSAGECQLDSAGGNFRAMRSSHSQPARFAIPIQDQSRGALDLISPSYSIQLPPQGIASQSDGYSEAQGLQPLGIGGQGLPGLLDYLLRKERRRFDAIIHTMRFLIRGLQDIEIETPNPNQRRIDFMIENGFRITADQASAGVRLLLFFVTLAYHPSPPKLVLLEEPEMGVHPVRLKEIVSFLRELAHGKHGGNPAQVVMTTHSPYLLDAVDLQTDQVLVFRRNEDGSRTAEAADAERLETFLDEFLLGEVWFNQGEEGLVSRRP